MQELILRTRRLNRLLGTRQAVSPILIGFGFLLATAAGAQAQTPAKCGLTVTKSIQFDGDLICVDMMGQSTTGIIVGADNITIDLHGFKMSCQDANGYRGSCQGPSNDPEDIGIDINGFDNVTIRGGGSIQGFDIGIDVRPGSDGQSFNVNIQKVNINGPDADGGLFGQLFQAPGPRPVAAAGIIVQSSVCPSGIVIFGNSIENYTTGIDIVSSCGVEVKMNFFHDNNGGQSSDSPAESHAIRLQNSPNNKVHNNLVIDNGTNLEADSAVDLVGLGTANNLVTNNNVSFNNGDGILVRAQAHDNQIRSNQALYNTSNEPTPPFVDPVTGMTATRIFYDLASEAAGPNNKFDPNNRCEAQSPGVTPSLVCAAGEGEAWMNQP
jgi:parallel beta-helix repeat protein